MAFYLRDISLFNPLVFGNMPVKAGGHSPQRSEGWPHKRNFCQSPGTGCVPEGDTVLAGDMGWGPGAAKWANPRC